MKHARDLNDKDYEHRVIASQDALRKHFLQRPYILTAISDSTSDNAERNKSLISASSSSFSSISSTKNSLDRTPEKFDFTACYADSDDGSQTAESEIDAFFSKRNIPRIADPLEWWGSTGTMEYPNVARLARDIFSIPGC
jgi:hypothetical protein